MPIAPLFAAMISGKPSLGKPSIRFGEKVYDEAKLISLLAESIKEDVSPLLDEEVGTLSFAGYLLLEALHLAKLPNEAELISKSTAELAKASWYCAIGFLAGRKTPPGIDIKTIFEDMEAFNVSNPSVLWPDKKKPSEDI